LHLFDERGDVLGHEELGFVQCSGAIGAAAPGSIARRGRFGLGFAGIFAQARCDCFD
jgi:hypothetical protein